jgi:hypothetical protein
MTKMIVKWDKSVNSIIHPFEVNIKMLGFENHEK